MMKSFIRKVCRILLRVFYVFPVHVDKVFLTCFNGTMIGFDAKAFADWSAENNKKLDLVWGISRNANCKELEFETGRLVRIQSLRGFYEMLTAKAIIVNIHPPTYVPFRKEQIIVNTWHGYPFKKVGRASVTSDAANFNAADAFISHSEEYTHICLNASMDFRGDILNCGAPRNDVFFTDKVQKNNELVRKRYGIEQQKILLWMPTFRGEHRLHHANIDFIAVLDALKRRFGGDWVVFVRLHPMIRNKVQYTGEMFVDVSNHQDAQELLCSADIMISDYSSAMWDYALLKRPVFVYAEDEEQYIQSRGLYKNMSELPFVVAHNMGELETAILQFDKDNYLSTMNKYFIEINCFETGKSSETIYKYIYTR